MFHNKAQPACLLCHCAVQPHERVAAALQDIQQPLFPLYRQLFCQKTHCYQCLLDTGPRSHCVHRDCYQYYRHLFPESQRLRLRDLLELWPDNLDFLSRHNAEREKHAYEEYFPRPEAGLFAHITKDNFGNFLRLIAEKVPQELVLDIAGFSWPCALQKPATIFREGQSLLDFARSQKSDHLEVLTFAGEVALVRYCNFLGHRYATSVAFQENTVVDCQNVLSVAVTRDEVGVLDINFQGQFQYSRPGLWYRFIQVETDNLELCVSTKNIIMDVELASIYAPFWNPYWNYQFLSQPEVRAWYARDCQTSLPQRMRYVELNDDIQGIIVGCCIDGFASLETYDGSGKPHSSARAMDKFSTRTTYIRFPLAQGEFITAAWIREPTDNSSFRQSILVLSTSFQRTCTFGHYVPREDESRYRYEPLIEHNTHQITGFCYNDNGNSSSRQKYIGVTHDEKPIEPLPDPPCQAAFTPPNHWIPQWFMSSACLAGAIRVQTFVNNKESHRPTMGMLLSYESHQESIGQYRFDWDVEDLDVTAPMYFFSGDTKFGPYVKVICNGEEKPDWKKIPRTARLVWWFTAVCSDLDVLTT